MNEQEIELGSVVELNSGSPKMTVVGISEYSYQCTWYDFNINVWKDNVYFPTFAVKLADK